MQARTRLAATKSPFVLLRVDGKKWTYLLDKSGSFPKPARFDALFVRCGAAGPDRSGLRTLTLVWTVPLPMIVAGAVHARAPTQ